MYQTRSIYQSLKNKYVRDSYGSSGNETILGGLRNKVKTGKAKKNEIRKYKMIGKAFYLIAWNSRHQRFNFNNISVV